MIEVVVSRKLFLTLEIDIDDDCTLEELADVIKKELKDEYNQDLDNWDMVDYRGKPVIEAYETYGGTDIPLDDED